MLLTPMHSFYKIFDMCIALWISVMLKLAVFNNYHIKKERFH